MAGNGDIQFPFPAHTFREAPGFSKAFLEYLGESEWLQTRDGSGRYNPGYGFGGGAPSSGVRDVCASISAV